MANESESNSIETASAGPFPVTREFATALYKQVTGPSQKMHKYYNGGRIIKDEDIIQLTMKFQQFLGQYKCASHNVSYTIGTANGERYEIRGLSRYKNYNRSGSSPVTLMEMKVSALIQIPDSEKFNNYEFSLSINSQDMSKFDPSFNTIFRKLLQPDLSANITYSSHVIALAATSIFDDWVAGLKRIECNVVLTTIRKFYKPEEDSLNIFGKIVQIVFLCLASRSSYLISVRSELLSDIKGLYISVIILLIMISASVSLAKMFSEKIKDELVLASEIVLMDFNRGDQKNIDEFRKADARSLTGVILSLLGLAGLVIINVFSSGVSDLIFGK